MFGCSYYLMQGSFFTTSYSRCFRSSFSEISRNFTKI
ncbi:alpha-mannosidase [Enterococcus faecium]|nr:alpha-mannosidase [Enterococcus faecium]PQC00126.1 alpha-mannosidase [Enterococcus faecium]PQD88575.1 alpha-mannosidase [Enterococcus faecium]PQD92332.1 alpha-mannosidase [Enterococcus faecium]PQF79531.1 alpha-mannosidase [Enterococcus faecium]